ncbi:MAG: Gfo/Idh/MocA family oxidoreductase [Rhodothermales bacterium]|nr:Gfo/Idh/MocA family oxidoreductase [Rhodothermales bacterium]
MKSFHINRRRFLQTASASLAYSMLGAGGLDAIYPLAPRRVGLIGTGWYGKSDLFRLMQVSEIDVVSICDPDKNQLSEAAGLIAKRQKSGKTPQTYGDYRTMLAQHEFDIVIVGTPDHWHALPTIDAIKAGAHVFVQKPVSVDVIEGEAMLAAARKYNKVVQVGTQRRSTPHLIEAKERYVDSGLLGEVSHVEMCCYYHMRANRSPELEPVPDFLDYEMWAGPAPLRPYDGLPHRGWWRAMMEYSNGIMGDMCVHMYDAVRWILGLGWPSRISSTGGIYVQKASKATTADTQHAVFEHGELNCVWQHRSWGTPADPDYPWSFKIYGDKGTLAGSPQQYDFIPVGQGERVRQECLYEREQFPEDLTEKDIELFAAPAMRRHMIDFLAAIDGGGRPVADILQGHISSASCIMANMSMDLGGRPLVYDTASRTVVGDPEATFKLRRPYRGAWEHPEPETV